MAEKQKCLTIKTYSFHNVLFETKNNLFTTKLLIICSGSDGNFENIKYNAILLIEKSISALAIGYFNILNDPAAINNTLIDYVEMLQII